MNDSALALLQLLCEQDAQSIHRVAKRLGFGLSELQRLLTALGDDSRFRWAGPGRATAARRAHVAGADRTRARAVQRRLMTTSMPDGLQSVDALHVERDARTRRTESVVEETPIALLYNGEPFAVMMATPVDLEDFALGFALTEGIVASADEFRLVDLVRNDHGITLHGAIPQSRFDALGERRRNLEGRSGCGLCGVESLDAAIRPIRTVTTRCNVSIAQIHAGLARLAQHQPLNAASGGVHAAGYAHADGIMVREDVGRHNALDKLIGALAASDRLDGFLVITSRASYEIVHKAAMADIAVVVAISVPTAMAIEVAQKANITLVAFARGDTMNVYSCSERIR